MNGPSGQALREGGVGGSLRYKNGTTIVVRLASGGPLPPAWKKKTTLTSVFNDFGQILRIDAPEAHNVAYVEYEDRRDADEAAREMNGMSILGQAVHVQVMTSPSTGLSGGSTDLQSRIAALAREHRLDEAAATRLANVFAERLRLGCDIVRDLAELSQHLGASNKPSALVSMKLAELRTGQPIGPCKYNRGQAQGDRPLDARKRDDYGWREERARDERTRDDRRRDGRQEDDRRGAREERGGRRGARSRSRSQRRGRDVGDRR